MFTAEIHLPLSIQMEILILYNCYITTYMLDSALEPPYNSSKNLLLPWMLKLMVDMVNESTPLIR